MECDLQCGTAVALTRLLQLLLLGFCRRNQAAAGMTDPYHNPDSLPASTIDAIITRLEERGRHPFFLAAINQYVAILERDRKLSILELGCGTGVVMRYVETLVHPTSVLRAADISEQFLQGAHVPCRMPTVISQYAQLRETAFRRRHE